MNDLTVHDILPAPARREFRAGIISISYRLLEEFGIDIDGTTTQGEFADKGVFATLHKKLLLPTSYTIRGIFLRWYGPVWNVVVESPDLPVVELGYEPPDITPIYRREDDGTAHLITIKIEEKWQRTYSPEELTLERL